MISGITDPKDAIKILKEAQPELQKLIGEILEQAGLTKESDYQGLIPILAFLYQFIWPAIKDLRSIEKALYAVLLAAYKFMEGLGSGIEGVPGDIESLFKAIKL